MVSQNPLSKLHTNEKATTSRSLGQGHSLSENELDLLCREELLSPPKTSPSRDTNNATLGAPKRKDDPSRSSSAATQSVMEYTLSTKLSEESSRLIFSSGLRARKKSGRKLKRQKSESNLAKPDNALSGPLFPEIGALEKLPNPANASPMLNHLRPVTPEHSKLNNLARPPPTLSSGAHRTSTITPANLEQHFEKESKKRKNRSPGGSTNTPILPEPRGLDDIVESATRMLSTLQATSTNSAAGSTSTGVSIPPSSRGILANNAPNVQAQPVLPPAMPSQQLWWPNAPRQQEHFPLIVPQKPSPARLEMLPMQPMQLLQQEEMALHLNPRPQQMQQHEDRLFDDVFSESEAPDDEAQLDLMSARDLEPDTSVYMCSRDPDNEDIPIEISTETLHRRGDSRTLPWFPVPPPPARALSSSQSSGALYFGERGPPLANNNNRLQQRQASPPMRNGESHSESEAPVLGTRTRAPLIDEEESEDEVKINLEEFFGQFDDSNNGAQGDYPVSPLQLERDTSSLVTIPEQQQGGVRVARTESIQGDEDIGGLLSHVLLPSPTKHGGEPLQYSSSI